MCDCVDVIYPKNIMLNTDPEREVTMPELYFSLLGRCPHKHACTDIAYTHTPL